MGKPLSSRESRSRKTTGSSADASCQDAAAGLFPRGGVSQLVACLPARWRALVEERSESLLIDLRADEMIVWREHADRTNEYARIARSLPADAQSAEFQRLRNAIDDPGVRTVLCIPPERVLQRNLTLPVAAEDNIRQVLAFEMDRQTPFKADQIYFDSRVTGRDASGRNLQVELVLLPRAQLDQELGALPPGASGARRRRCVARRAGRRAAPDQSAAGRAPCASSRHAPAAESRSRGARRDPASSSTWTSR